MTPGVKLKLCPFCGHLPDVNSFSGAVNCANDECPVTVECYDVDQWNTRAWHHDIEALEADLFEAVQVAYSRGATAWASLNYPQWIDPLNTVEQGSANPALDALIRTAEDMVARVPFGALSRPDWPDDKMVATTGTELGRFRALHDALNAFKKETAS